MAATSHRPPRLGEFSQGWRVLFASTLGCALGASAFTTATLGFFMPALKAEHGWDRVQVGAAATVFLIGMLCFLPIVGRLCDRYGSRAVALVSIGLLAAALALMGLFVDTLVSFYIGYFAIALGGAGTSFIVYSRAVNTWFSESRGLALGIMIAGTGLTMAAAPFLMVRVLDAFGSRGGYFALAALAASALLVVAPWFRERAAPMSAVGSATTEGLTFRQILQTRQFWTLGVALVLISPVFSGAVVHLAPMYTDMGANSMQVQLAAGCFGFSMILARPLIGQMLDRLHGPLVAAAALMAPALALIVAGHAGTGFAIVYAVALGIGLSAESDLVGFLSSRYFGMRAYSEAYGWLFAASTLGFALGPVLAGKAYAVTGDYELARLGAAACCVLGAVCFLSLGPVPKIAPTAAIRSAA